MRYISTVFFCLILFFSTLYAQESSNLKIQGLKILNRRPPLTTSDTEPFVIRCLASNLNPDPLLIIDGIVAEKSRFKNIDPDNIDSIWILKGHAAAALYGCRAMSGAIVITTKTANQTSIMVKDMLTGEILASANVDLIPMDGRKDTTHLITDSPGKIVTNKSVYGKEYELKASNVGYKNFRCIVSSKQLAKNYNVLLERNYEDLEEVRIKSVSMKLLRRRTNSAYFDGLYGSIRCLIAGVNVLSNDRNNIQVGKSIVTIKLYPNPVRRFHNVTIEFENEEDTKVTVRLFCLDGKLINSREYQMKEGINRIFYSLTGSLTTGIYVLHVIDENNRLLETDKLIIQ